MYTAHFALGLAVKASEPRIPTWVALTAVSFPDLLFGFLAITGVETVRPAPGAFPGVEAVNIGWSHSVVSGIVAGSIFAVVFWRRGMKAAGLIFALAASHNLMDILMHPWPVPWYPGATRGLGFGLWHHLPFGWWVVEGTLTAAGIAFYWSRVAVEQSQRARASRVVCTVALLHLLSIPILHRLTSHLLF